MNWIDFIIGGLLVNSLPHFVMGITKTRFLGLFGFSAMQNIAYAFFQIIVAIGLIFYQYDLAFFVENGVAAGGLAVAVMFMILGKPFLRIFNTDKPYINLKYLYYFYTDHIAIVEVKNLDIDDSAPPADRFFWLLIDLESKLTMRLDFKSMSSDDDFDYRIFNQATLKFDDQKATFKLNDGDSDVTLHAGERDLVPNRITKLTQQFFQRY